jgi:hypothetical protein
MHNSFEAFPFGLLSIMHNSFEALPLAYAQLAFLVLEPLGHVLSRW